VVLWRLRYNLSLRDLPEIFVIRGTVSSHEAVHHGETKLAPASAEICGDDDAARQAAVGGPMKRTSKCRGSGVTSGHKLMWVQAIALWSTYGQTAARKSGW